MQQKYQWTSLYSQPCSQSCLRIRNIWRHENITATKQTIAFLKCIELYMKSFENVIHVLMSPNVGMQKLSITVISRQFNERVLMKHCFLYENCLLHFMDADYRYSPYQPVPFTALAPISVAFEKNWICQFWRPERVEGDIEFQHNQSSSILQNYSI